MESRDWLLLALKFAGQKGLSPVQLQKTLFLLGEKLPEEVNPGFYEFVPYNYGPFCAEVYSDAESLEREGSVKIHRDGRRWPQYFVTPEGEPRAGNLEESANHKAAAYLRSAVEWAQGLSFQALVRTIYQHFPKYKVNSVFSE